MNGNCHCTLGLAIGAMLALNMDSLSVTFPNIKYSAETATLLIEGCLIGGIFPDIDNPKSFMGRLSYPLSRYIDKIGKKFGKGGKYHRGLFHDIFAYSIGLLLSYFCLPTLVGFFIGCISHIYLDLFNPTGIPSLIKNKNIHFGNILSGSKQAISFTRLNVVLVLLLGILTKFNLLSF